MLTRIPTHRDALTALQNSPGYRPGDYQMPIAIIHEARFVLFDADTRLLFATSFDGPRAAGAGRVDCRHHRYVRVYGARLRRLPGHADEHAAVRATRRSVLARSDLPVSPPPNRVR